MSYDEWKAGHKKKEKTSSNDLSNDEKRALNSYISSDSYKINEKLRNRTSLTREDKTFIKNLDSALKKMPKYSGSLIRTVDFSYYKNASQKLEEYVSHFKLNKDISFREYISTSKKSGYNEFANVKIYIQDSKNGRDISKFNEKESEVVYERNSTFRVVDIVLKDNEYYILLNEKESK